MCRTEVSQSLQHWLENQSAADATEFADDDHLVTADESGLEACENSKLLNFLIIPDPSNL